MSEEILLRTQAKKTAAVKDKIIGGERQLVCLPIVAADIDDLIAQAKEAVLGNPDLIEWRADSYDRHNEIMTVCHKLRKITGDIPLIFTLRHIEEGGVREIPQHERAKTIKEVIGTGLFDLVDVEIMNGEAFISEIKENMKKYGCKLILSYHNFQHTPSEEFIKDKLKEAEELGADIAKLAAMPTDYKDVLRLLNAALTAKREIIEIPIITIAMGKMGIISRIDGGYFGSDVTFAAGKTLSAPGQIKLADLINIMKIHE